MRNLGLDLLKIFSCIGVVVLHSTRSGFNLEHYNISAHLYYLGTYAIPLFFMLNGYFLLNKKKLPYSYVFNKIRGILTIVFVWNMLIWMIKRDFNVNPLMKIIGSLIQEGYAYQFWFFWIVNNNIFDITNSKKIIGERLFILCYFVNIDSYWYSY